MKDYDDWAEHMIWAEQNLKSLELNLINKEYEGLDKKILNVLHALTRVSDWLDRHVQQAEQ